jgi:nicotinamide-nucleotide amidase
MFQLEQKKAATRALDAARAADVRICTVETVTSGLVSACLTAVSGASQVFERGWVLYHDSAKASGLGLDESVAREHGAVSEQVTRGLAEGGLQHSSAGVCVAVTGYAGPGGGSDADPVGTCYVAAASPGRETTVERHRFEGDRDQVRMAAAAAAVDLIARHLAATG